MSPAVTIKEQRSQVKSWPEALGQQWASVSLEESILSQQTSNSHKMGRFCVSRKTDSKQKNKQKNEFTVLLYVQYDLHLTLIKCFYYTCVYVMKKKDGAWDRKRGGHVWEQLKLTVYGCERHEHWASETLLSSVLHELQKTFPLPALPGREVLSDLTNSWGPFCPKYTHSPDDKVRLFSVPLHSQHTYLCGRLALKQDIFYIIMS